jgi:pseudoazurin
MLFLGMASLAASTLGLPSWAQSRKHVVEMLNKAPDSNERQVFNPPVLQIEVGDSVLFEATDRGHNAESNSDMIPEGSAPWKSKIGEDFEVKFDVPGVYGYHCTPHRSAGMVGLVMVGQVSEDELEIASSVRHRSKAKSRYADYFEIAKSLI